MNVCVILTPYDDLTFFNRNSSSAFSTEKKNTGENFAANKKQSSTKWINTKAKI